MTHNETDYHSWALPDEGATEWHTEYYETVDDIDQKLFKHGPSASRDSEAPDGALYWATDEHTLYQYDAGLGQWTELGTFWQGYELVLGDEAPQTDQYIRFASSTNA